MMADNLNVIAITSADSDWAVAVVQMQEELQPGFLEEARKCYGWESLGNDPDDPDDALAAQTFCAWYRKLHPSASIDDCLNNEQYTWESFEVDVV